MTAPHRGEPRQYLTYREVEQLLRVSPRTRRRLFRRHGVAVVSLSARSKLVSVAEICRLLARCGARPRRAGDQGRREADS